MADDVISDSTTQAAQSAAIPSPREDGQAPRAVDEERLNALLGTVIGDLGGLLTAPLVRLGDRLGLFTALAAAGASTSSELADRTGLTERYVREWLLAMAASGYVDHLGEGRFELSPEQVQLFVEADSPAYVLGGFQNMTAAVRAQDRLVDAFRSGAGMGWHEHHADMFEGTERFFRPGYLANLTTGWIPALTGLERRLEQGARVADVGCGLGASTRIMAERYPRSTFLGLDYHEVSIATARDKARDLADRLSFQVAGAQDLTGDYDLITFFDCLHDMPDPVAALRTARQAIADDGWVMLVEPASGDRLEDALNPVGRLFAAASVFICLPSGLSAEPAAGMGNQAGPARTLALAEEAGFSRAREATRGPFNVVYELRP
jgi:2-polyprenyl-3-methyl-5-hydroxy-6-metoxy-1,4-benzoquinol methylase